MCGQNVPLEFILFFLVLFQVFSTLDPFRASSQRQAVQCRICPFPVIVQVNCIEKLIIITSVYIYN